MMEMQVGRARDKGTKRQPRVQWGWALVAHPSEPERAWLSATLRGQGFWTLEFSDGRDLLAYLGDTLLERPKPTLMTIDTRVSGWDALEVLSSLRHAGWGLPLLITGCAADAQKLALAESFVATAGVHLPPLDDPARFAAALQHFTSCVHRLIHRATAYHVPKALRSAAAATDPTTAAC